LRFAYLKLPAHAGIERRDGVADRAAQCRCIAGRQAEQPVVETAARMEVPFGRRDDRVVGDAVAVQRDLVQQEAAKAPPGRPKPNMRGLPPLGGGSEGAA